MAKRRAAPPPAEVSPDDLDLFAREVAGDRPLARDAKERVRVSPLPAIARSAKVGAGINAPANDDGDGEASIDSYVAPGVDRRELRKLRRGDYEPDMRMDLHGLISKEAVARVTHVLDAGPGRRPRCLCVVHGRGLHSEGNVAVLKSRIRAVLSQHPAVLAFADAPRTDGGQGAVYVLLRR